MTVDEIVRVVIRKDTIGYRIQEKISGEVTSHRYLLPIMAYLHVECLRSHYKVDAYYSGFRDPLELEVLMRGMRTGKREAHHDQH